MGERMRGLDAAELEAWLSALELSAEDSAKLMAVATVPIETYSTENAEAYLERWRELVAELAGP